MKKDCIRCGGFIESERLEALPETELCIACAKLVQPKRVKGVMLFDGVVPTTVCVMSSRHFDILTASTCYESIPEEVE